MVLYESARFKRATGRLPLQALVACIVRRGDRLVALSAGLSSFVVPAHRDGGLEESSRFKVQGLAIVVSNLEPRTFIVVRQ